MSLQGSKSNKHGYCHISALYFPIDFAAWGQALDPVIERQRCRRSRCQAGEALVRTVVDAVGSWVLSLMVPEAAPLRCRFLRMLYDRSEERRVGKEGICE